MPITIEVYRDAGDRHGGEISEPLLGDSLPAALARGRAELDAHAWQQRTLDIEAVFAPTRRLGDLVEVMDPTLGAAVRGKVVGIAHQDSGESVITTLTLEVQQHA